MKVGFVLSQPFGNSIGTDVRINGLLKGLSALGIEIHIITPFSESIRLNEENIFVHNIESLSTKLHISNSTYWLTKKFFGNPFLFRKLICNKSLLTRNASSIREGVYKISKKLDLDVLQAEQPIASIACVGLRDKLSIPIVADFHGVWCEEMVASNIVGYDDVCYETLFQLEQEIAQSASVATVVSEEMRDFVIRSFDVPQNQVVLIPNATFLRVDNATAVENPFRVIHSGTLHPWERVELFVESMPFVLRSFPSARFYLTRKGAKLKNMMKLAHSLNVTPDFFWFNKGADFLEFLRSCHVGVISSTEHIARKMAYPAKLYDYLSVGLPIVANDLGTWTKILEDEKVGLVVDSSPEAFADGILEFLQNPDLIFEYGQRGIDLVKKKLNYYESAKKLLSLYNSIL